MRRPTEWQAGDEWGDRVAVYIGLSSSLNGRAPGSMEKQIQCQGFKPGVT